MTDGFIEAAMIYTGATPVSHMPENSIVNTDKLKDTLRWAFEEGVASQTAPLAAEIERLEAIVATATVPKPHEHEWNVYNRPNGGVAYYCKGCGQTRSVPTPFQHPTTAKENKATD